jgi:hypothetical protein
VWGKLFKCYSWIQIEQNSCLISNQNPSKIVKFSENQLTWEHNKSWLISPRYQYQFSIIISQRPTQVHSINSKKSWTEPSKSSSSVRLCHTAGLTQCGLPTRCMVSVKQPTVLTAAWQIYQWEHISTIPKRDTTLFLVPTSTGYPIWGILLRLSSGRPDTLRLAFYLGRARLSEVAVYQEGSYPTRLVTASRSRWVL